MAADAAADAARVAAWHAAHERVLSQLQRRARRAAKAGQDPGVAFAARTQQWQAALERENAVRAARNGGQVTIAACCMMV